MMATPLFNRGADAGFERDHFSLDAYQQSGEYRAGYNWAKKKVTKARDAKTRRQAKQGWLWDGCPRQKGVKA